MEDCKSLAKYSDDNKANIKKTKTELIIVLENLFADDIHFFVCTTVDKFESAARSSILTINTMKTE